MPGSASFNSTKPNNSTRRAFLILNPKRTHTYKLAKKLADDILTNDAIKTDEQKLTFCEQFIQRPEFDDFPMQGISKFVDHLVNELKINLDKTFKKLLSAALFHRIYLKIFNQLIYDIIHSIEDDQLKLCENIFKNNEQFKQLTFDSKKSIIKQVIHKLKDSWLKDFDAIQFENLLLNALQLSPAFNDETFDTDSSHSQATTETKSNANILAGQLEKEDEKNAEVKTESTNSVNETQANKETIIKKAISKLASNSWFNGPDANSFKNSLLNALQSSPVSSNEAGEKKTENKTEPTHNSDKTKTMDPSTKFKIDKSKVRISALIPKFFQSPADSSPVKTDTFNDASPVETGTLSDSLVEVTSEANKFADNLSLDNTKPERALGMNIGAAIQGNHYYKKLSENEEKIIFVNAVITLLEEKGFKFADSIIWMQLKLKQPEAEQQTTKRMNKGR